MPKDTKEVEAQEPKKQQLYYTNPEVKGIVEKKLRLSEINYLSVKVTTKYIEIIQGGKHDSAGAIASLLSLPGIFGFDDDNEDPSEITVRFDKDQFNVVTRTVTTLDRSAAEPMFADDGVNDDAEGTHTELEDDGNEGDGEGTDPKDLTREDIMSMNTKPANELLKLHGLDPADFKNIGKKRDALIKTIFIDLDEDSEEE